MKGDRYYCTGSFYFSKMKIQIISDLHQEFGSTDLFFENADIVVLAGDINLGTKGIEWIKLKIEKKPVVYVLGNHEYTKVLIRKL